MKKANFIVLTIMVLALCFVSCGGDSDSGESPYVAFSGATYNSGGKWYCGIADSDPNVRTEPFASFDNSYTSGLGLKSNIGGPNLFAPTTTIAEFLYVAFQGNQAKSYSGSSQCVIMVKSGTYSVLKLTSPSVNITEYSSNVIGGTFSGEDSGNIITGSFLFENVGDGNWYWPTIPW